MATISSAEPQTLARYSTRTLALDVDLVAASARLAGALVNFEAHCRESGFQVHVGHLPGKTAGHAARAQQVDVWVGVVANSFRLADSGTLQYIWFQEVPGWLHASSLWLLLPPLWWRLPSSRLQNIEDYVIGVWPKVKFPIGGPFLTLVEKLRSELFFKSRLQTPSDFSAPKEMVPQEPFVGDSIRESPGKKVSVPYIDQTSYSGKHDGAGPYLCSAAALTMALQAFSGTNRVTFDDTADSLIEKKYLDERGLLSGDYLVKYVAEHPELPVSAEYAGDRRFDSDYLQEILTSGGLVIVTVPGHYTLVRDSRKLDDGTVEFRMSDSYRNHWPKNDRNAALRKEWISESELRALWDGDPNSGRHTIIRSKAK